MAQVDTTPKTNNIDLEDEDEVTTSPAASEHTKAKTSSAVFDDDDVDFGNEDEFRRAGELENLKIPQKNTFGRFSVLINPATGKAFVKKGYVHYVAGKGYARCLSKHDAKGNFIGEPAFCCKAGKDGEKRFAILIVRYLSVDPKTGKFYKDRPVEVEIQAACVSRIGYKDISQLAAEDELVTDLDITATPKEETKGLKFARISGKASYRHSPALKNAVDEAMKPFLDSKELRSKIGRALTPTEMRLHMGVGVSTGDDGPGMDDDI